MCPKRVSICSDVEQVPKTSLADVFFVMDRYSKITEKRPREIVLLRGRGCAFPTCAFCDYHEDRSSDEAANFALNSSVLERVTGEYGEIEIINSGSVFELDKQTMAAIKRTCRERGISTIHFESHWRYRKRISALREEFSDFTLKMKLGLETFDADFREKALNKGIDATDPAKIAVDFDEANFLFGLTGQTADGMQRDIELGLANFERICLNIMCENSTPVKPDANVIDAFVREVMPHCVDDDRVDILINNTDFGVGD